MSTDQKILQALQALQQDVATVKTDIKTLKTDVGTLKTDVGTLKTDVTEIKTIQKSHGKALARLQKDQKLILKYHDGIVIHLRSRIERLEKVVKTG